jgi:hypothetical protein
MNVGSHDIRRLKRVAAGVRFRGTRIHKAHSASQALYNIH